MVGWLVGEAAWQLDPTLTFLGLQLFGLLNLLQLLLLGILPGLLLLFFIILDTCRDTNTLGECVYLA